MYTSSSCLEFLTFQNIFPVAGAYAPMFKMNFLGKITTNKDYELFVSQNLKSTFQTQLLETRGQTKL
jgi:hypothetical protein